MRLCDRGGLLGGAVTGDAAGDATGDNTSDARKRRRSPSAAPSDAGDAGDDAPSDAPGDPMSLDEGDDSWGAREASPGDAGGAREGALRGALAALYRECLGDVLAASRRVRICVLSACAFAFW